MCVCACGDCVDRNIATDEECEELKNRASAGMRKSGLAYHEVRCDSIVCVWHACEGVSLQHSHSFVRRGMTMVTLILLFLLLMTMMMAAVVEGAE